VQHEHRTPPYRDRRLMPGDLRHPSPTYVFTPVMGNVRHRSARRVHLRGCEWEPSPIRETAAAAKMLLVCGWLRAVPSAAEPKSSLRFAPPRHAPRGVLLGRHTTRYPSLVGLAIHAPERRQPQRNLGDTTLARSRCTWHARHVQRERPTQRGMSTVDPAVDGGSQVKTFKRAWRAPSQPIDPAQH
jgi:hypothetical protein